jgi:hypothetical protein
VAKHIDASRSPSEPRAAAEGLKGKQEMAIGRTDERRNPLIPVALTGRAVVWMSLADPIWAQRTASRVKGRTHDRIRTKATISQTYLNPTGRPHMVLLVSFVPQCLIHHAAPNGYLLFEASDSLIRPCKLLLGVCSSSRGSGSKAPC